MGKMIETFDSLLIRISIKGNDFREVREEKKIILLLWNGDQFDRVKCKIITINIYDNKNINY